MKYKATGNNVLIEIDLNVEITKGLMLDMSFNPELVPTVGKVISVTDSLVNKRDVDGLIDQDHHIEWECDIDLKEGDTVVFDYLMAIKNLGFKLQDIKNEYDDWGRWVIIDGKLNIFMNYDNLYMRIRDGEFTTLNGYVIIKPEKEKSLFIKANEFNLRKGICKFTGKANKSYFDKDKHTLMPKEGEQIIFMDHANIKLTPKYYKLFSEELWLTPGYRIIGTF